MYDHQHLMATVISRSVSKEWNIAKSEWYIDGVDYTLEPKQCVCLHEPIKKIYLLKNKNNNHTLEVGRICVQEFLTINDKKLAHDMIFEYPENKIFLGMINFLRKNHILRIEDISFLESLAYKEVSQLSDDQIIIRNKILERIRSGLES